MSSASEYNRRVQAFKRQVDAYNRQVQTANRRLVQDHNANVRAINDHNQKVASQNRAQQRRIEDYNRRAEVHNKKVVSELNRRLAARPVVRMTETDRALVDRVQESIVFDEREFDVFLSYAKIDGYTTALQLCRELEALGLRVWFDEVTLRPGQSQARQMDIGLRKARSGLVVLTPAYLAGRFWTERELGVLLSKSTLIPVLHNCTFEDAAEYSGILPDLVGFETCRYTLDDIAGMVAEAVTPPEMVG